jgi:hypothetical protein
MELNFIDQFNKDVAAIVGFPVEVKVLRGSLDAQKESLVLDMKNVSEYDYSILQSEEYRVMASPAPEPTRTNGYWDGGVAHFYLQYLPGCCGVCLSYHALTMPKFQGKKIGYLCRVLRQNIAKAQGFSTLLSTATTNNYAQNKLMKSTSAQSLYSFRNERSSNEVIISAFDLRDSQTDTARISLPAGKKTDRLPGSTIFARL